MTIRPTRRTLLGTGGAVALLAGCSKYGDSNNSSSQSTSGTPSGSPSGTASATASGGAAAGPELAKTSDIPVGGGTIFKDEKVVVTQPEQGEFKAFSAVCTHQGCTVSTVSDGTINCPCHGSKFRITDASVAAGPAPRPLPAEKITVEGNSIRLT
ncbi:iron sulfur protein [Streptomyces avermitilis]|uniref:Cytochrome bc1 complex Rieske iron-sulfur subunit n=2 Tax=Streptomyces avermitilis TaxID=33903 RepID=Q828Z4_STRAW|nr:MULTISPECIES: Rieske (2Fe-2S) protein [Streptomyces]KUN53916.1 iron sulfur protein [Streptomyces avermitilis]MYT02063.1 Rieske 2Fe-2S domain-containing protein [Streptomyces sp. SID5469]OOV30025.1 iron sulfur protein [Streptomyces avermitilis]BAC74228.1 putative iron-sulfur protein [Streptomyces avermitilis MA-4680 = NBRC 14893]BBJ54773.1 iron-sulfur protein [Streptomyces avermitilis]